MNLNNKQYQVGKWDMLKLGGTTLVGKLDIEKGGKCTFWEIEIGTNMF